MTFIAQAIGFACMILGGTLVIVMLWLHVVEKAGRAWMENKEFFAVLVRYAKEKKKKRMFGVDE